MNGREMLKALAQQAKDRLRARNCKGVNCVKDNVIRTVIIKSDDEQLYNKVKDVVNLDIVNPMAELIDINYYKTLTNEQKERYFFELSDKFRELKSRYEKEKIKQVN